MTAPTQYQPPSQEDWLNDPGDAARRLIEYEKQTKPLIDYYAQRGLLIRVDASEERDANYKTLAAALDAWLAGRDG